jgi:NADPH2:quinone reductase
MSSVVVATAFGGPEVLSLIEEDLPEPGAGEVLIEVRAVGVNPSDVKSYSGAFGSDPASLPLRVGSEAAGVVSAVGVDATGPAGPISVGDEVIAYRAPGAYAQRLLVPGEAVLPRPASLSWAQSAGLLLTGATAVHALTAAGVGSGHVVLIHAAAGGVGLAAVQTAVALGARVIGTAAPSDHDLLRSLGAEPVVYGVGLADRVRTIAPDGIDAALDLIGSDEALDVSIELVTDHDRIATINNFGPAAAAAGIKVLGGGPGADPGTEIRTNARLDLVHLAADGKLVVRVDRTFPLADAAAAHRYLQEGRARGKLALIP